MRRTIYLCVLLTALITTACNVIAPASTGISPTTAPSLPTLSLVPTLPPVPTQPPAPTITPSPTIPPPTPTLVNPVDALKGAFRIFAGVKSFRAKTTTTGGAGGTQETTMEVVPPDRFHMLSKDFEAYIISGTFYMKIGNQWQKAAMPKGFDLSSADPKKLEAEFGISTETKFIGPDVLDGVPMLVYEYTTTIKTPTPTTTTSKVWVGVADGLPRKRETVSKSGIKSVTLYYDYNANIVIQPPIK